eukprot:763009-Hanusia_phi.AAC.3
MAGLVGRAEVVVSRSVSAMEMKSGSLEVFATPAMVALMEEVRRRKGWDRVPFCRMRRYCAAA